MSKMLKSSSYVSDSENPAPVIGQDKLIWCIQILTEKQVGIEEKISQIVAEG